MTAPQLAVLIALRCAQPHPLAPELLCANVECPGDVHTDDEGNRWTDEEEIR